jgi:flagellar basal-body rod modification protein FlgD
MAASAIYPTSASTSATSSGTSALTSAASKSTLAENFQSFLQLLTTQLQHQSPLDPLDTNQFTQQLVQFAQVEQQLKSNQQLETLVSLQKTAQQTQALGFVGTTVAVDGATTKLASGKATWSFTASKPANAMLTITNSSGQTVYSGRYTVQAGRQSFVWDGRDNTGTKWPDGAYKLSVTATDTSGQAVGVATEVEGVVESVDLTTSTPELSIGGDTFTLDKIKRVIRAAS